MKAMKLITPPAILFFMFFTGSCNNTAKQTDQEPPSLHSVAKVIDISDTLPDTPRFEFTVDQTSYSVNNADISVHFSESDSTLSIAAGNDDTARLSIVIPDARHFPGFRGNAWRSDNTKLAGSDSLVWRPTIELYKKEAVLFSWNNLNDGYHEPKPVDDKSIYVYSLRQTGNHRFLIKGRIRTAVLKNVYAEASKDFNRDHTIEGSFVIAFDDYWLKL
jgi:hypothetical protein